MLFWTRRFRSRVNEVIVLFYRFKISSATLRPSRSGKLTLRVHESASAVKSGCLHAVLMRAVKTSGQPLNSGQCEDR